MCYNVCMERSKIIKDYYEHTLASICRKEGKFILSSGIESNIKWDIEELFKCTYEKRLLLLKQFFNLIKEDDISIIGIPTGGELLARDLKIYLGETKPSDRIILIDDVMTTGNTIRKFSKDLNIYSIAVLVNRSDINEINGIPVISYLTCDTIVW